jgi:hypothetical protein
VVAFVIAKPPIAAEMVFEHAECFYQAFAALRNLSPDPRENILATVTLVEPLIMIAALTTELFLKCLICIEKRTGYGPTWFVPFLEHAALVRVQGRIGRRNYKTLLQKRIGRDQIR